MGSTVFSVSKSDYDFFLNYRDKVLFDYAVQEEILLDYVKSHPDNVLRDVIKQKVHLLNRFYSTRVRVEEMVENIMKIQDLDIRLKKGDETLVHEIARNKKDYLSFATKFCAMHNPDKFPIFDSSINKILTHLNKNGFFNGTRVEEDTFKHLGQSEKSKSLYYADYKLIYDEFLKKSGISSYAKNYREVDYVLWGASVIRMKTLDNSVKPKKDVSGILVKVFGDIFIGIASNAIWVLVSNIFK